MRRKTDDYEHHYDSGPERCGYCDSSGYIEGEICQACDGTGYEPGYDDDED